MAATPIDGFTPTTPTASTAATTAAQTLSGPDFIKVMLAQLQQQDPLNPTDSNQMLTQLSTIQSMESNQALATNLNGLTLQQSIGAGGNLIGKSVTGLDATGASVSGNVTSVKVQSQSVFLELDSGKEVPLSNVTNIAQGAAAAAATVPATVPAAAATTPAPTASTGISGVLNNAAGLLGL
jgi:flagellar basal-body rod modification protein FlgD